MSLINVIEILIMVGIVLFVINNYIPMDAKIKSILNSVFVIAVIVWLLRIFGILDSLSHITIGK
jgi:hypothetical protein